VDQVRVTWPDGTTRNLPGVAANQLLVVDYPAQASKR
jgi:hypothetical protein